MCYRKGGLVKNKFDGFYIIVCNDVLGNELLIYFLVIDLSDINSSYNIRVSGK